MFFDLFREVIWSLAGNKVRSGLTILGIVIGIASVITMVSIGQGAQSSIESSIQSIGSNLIVVMPGANRHEGPVSSGRGSAQTLKISDAEAIEKEIKGIKGVAPEISKRYQVTAKGKNTNTSVVGTVPSYPSIRNVKMNIGSFITEQQIKNSSKVAVLGPTTRDDLFGENVNPVGSKIRINGIDFDVSGVTESKGGSGPMNFDDTIYVPLTTASHFLSGDDFVSSISVTAENPDLMSGVEENITSLLLKKHNITDPNLADFNLMNQTDIISTASSVTGTFTILLSSIAGISLLVGGIGIMNMMLTTVTERTREIGLRKAVGIRKIYINLQFLGEAVVLTFFGGALGVLLGYLASTAISSFVPSIKTEIALSSVLLAFGVSTAVGIIFGFYPARRAANLSPIEALRYE